MHKFNLTHAKKGVAALTAGAVLAVSGCQAAEVLNFYRVLTAGTQFDNYKYTIVLECDQFKDIVMQQQNKGALSSGTKFSTFMDGFALTGIITDKDAFSTAFQMKVDGQYKDITQIVIRDDTIYIDLGSILDSIKLLSPDAYTKSIQPALDGMIKSIDENPDAVNQSLAQYGLTAEQIKSRLANGLGWVSISYSSIDKTVQQFTDGNAAIKDAIPVTSLTEIKNAKYPEAIQKFAGNLGTAIEKRFLGIKPALTDVDKSDSSVYTFHLCNDNFEAFLDGCIAFIEEDLMNIVDETVTDFNKEGMTDVAKAAIELKEKLLEETTDYAVDGSSTKVTAMSKFVDSLKKAKENFAESDSKSKFDILSFASLKGSEGGREWKLGTKASLENNDGEAIENTDIRNIDLNCTITMQEFKDASAALGAMANPGAEALSLNTAVENAMTAMSSTMSGFSGVGGYSEVSPIDDSGWGTDTGNTGSDWGSYEYSGPLDLSNVQVYDANGNPLTPVGSDDTTDTSFTSQEGTKDYGSILTYENLEEYANAHPEEEDAITAWFETDAGQAWVLGYYEWYMNQLGTDTPATTTSSDSFTSSSSSPAFATGDVATANNMAKQIFDTLNVALSSLKTQGVSFNAYSKISGGHSYLAGSYDYWSTDGLSNVTGTDAFGNFGSARASDPTTDTLERYLAYQLVESGVSYNQECAYVAIVNPNGDLVSVAVTLDSSVMIDSKLPSYDSDGKVSSSWTGVTELGYIVGTYNNPSL